MREVTTPDLKVSEFFLGAYDPKTKQVNYQYSNKIKFINQSHPIYAGTIAWATAHPNDTQYIENRKKLIKYHSLLQGRGISNLLLTPDYKPTPPPDGFIARVQSSNISSDGTLNVTFSVSDDSYEFEEDIFVNIGTRLYYVLAVRDRTLTVTPEVEPPSNATAEFLSPFVKAVVLATSPMGRRGSGLISYTFPWFEYTE